MCPHGVVIGCQRRRKQREQSKSSAFTASGSMSRSFCKEKNYCLLLWRKYFTSFLSIQLRKSRKLRLVPVCASSWFPQWWHCRSCREPRKAVGFLRSAFSCWISACGLWSWNPPRYRFHSPFLGRPAKEDLGVRLQITIFHIYCSTQFLNPMKRYEGNRWKVKRLHW